MQRFCMLLLTKLLRCSDQTFHTDPSQDHEGMVGASQFADGAAKVLIHHALIRLCDFLGNYVGTGNYVVSNW